MLQRDTLADNVLRDLRAGVEDTALMDKYQLSYVELRNLYLELFKSGRLLGPKQEEQNISLSQSPQRTRKIIELGASRRDVDRYRLYFDVPVYELERPEIVGFICDLTENGLGVVGVDAEVDEVKTLVVEGDTFCDVAPFELQARCCWVEKDEGDEEVRAGFEVIDIDAYDRHQFDKLIELAVV